ncbi:MAG: hypothetical protein WKF91_20675, partial [Segetibacter sp.]
IMVIMLALGLIITTGAIASGNDKRVNLRARVIVVLPYYGYAPGFGTWYLRFYNPYNSPPFTILFVVRET